MIEEINQMKRKLAQLMKDHDLNDEVVLKASWELDNLILKYYSKESNQIKPKESNHIRSKENCKVYKKENNKTLIQ